MMQGRICLVTGANRGIGRATAEGLAREGAVVLMVCRDRELGEVAKAQITAATGNHQVELFIADLSVQSQVRQLVDDVKARHARLDVVINNAGAYSVRRTMTADDIEATFAVNHLACFILVNGLAGVLRASAPARVVVVASEAHQRVSDPEDWGSVRRYNARTAYNRSKLANVIFSYDLAHRLEGTGVTVNCCHPGVVDTPVLRGLYDRWWSRWMWPIVRRFIITPEEGARTPLYLAGSPDVEGVTGKYFKDSRPATSSLITHDPVIGARLWNLSLRLTGELPPITVTGEIIAAH
jgi:retinol dehydrogenase 14